MPDISFECPKCGQHLASEPEDAGAEVVCPTCGNEVSIPAPFPPNPEPGDAKPMSKTRRTVYAVVTMLISTGVIVGLLIALAGGLNSCGRRSPDDIVRWLAELSLEDNMERLAREGFNVATNVQPTSEEYKGYAKMVRDSFTTPRRYDEVILGFRFGDSKRVVLRRCRRLLRNGDIVGDVRLRERLVPFRTGGLVFRPVDSRAATDTEILNGDAWEVTFKPFATLGDDQDTTLDLALEFFEGKLCRCLVDSNQPVDFPALERMYIMRYDWPNRRRISTDAGSDHDYFSKSADARWVHGNRRIVLQYYQLNRPGTRARLIIEHGDMSVIAARQQSDEERAKGTDKTTMQGQIEASKRL
jgi:DNA-directed RNA polymerase subunit RPC12/RpoP